MSLRRRDFIAALGGAVVAWPVLARAQQVAPMRRIGVLMQMTESDRQGQLRVAAFRQSLEKLGWTDGRNVRIDYRWGNLDVERMRKLATELVGPRPDVLFAGDTSATATLRPETRSIPIVFAVVSDPIGAGFVASLARPGGNITGFMPDEPPLAGKWVQLLKSGVPGLRRVAYVFNPEVALSAGEFVRHAQAAAAPLRVELSAAAVRNDEDVTEVLADFAREPNGGLIIHGDAFTSAHRERIIAVAARHRLPAIYPYSFYARDGGLISYGADIIDQYRQAGTYVDRILRGAKPADLPVQAPTRFELVINLKTAKAIPIDVSRDMLSIAVEVIE
jgi:putative ABC transport system substrate-binding protein